MLALASFLHWLADEQPHAPALVDRDRPISYRALAGESARLATGLASLGIGAGDRVALWLPNLPAWLATFFSRSSTSRPSTARRSSTSSRSLIA
jgi:fatty-acyl-CoA synthase